MFPNDPQENKPEQPVTPAPSEPQTEQPVTPPESQPTPPYDPYGWHTPPTYSAPTPSPQPPVKKPNGAKIAIAVIGVLCAVTIIVLSVLVGLLYRNGGTLFPAPTDTDSGTINAPTLQITELDEDAEGLTTTEIVDRNLDSTVLLTIYSSASSNAFPFGQTTEQEVKSGSASGIVMSADGYIITNWHCVVNESTNEVFPRIDVTMYDGTVYEYAEVIGHDSSTDLAVIKVDATDLKPAEFGNSDNLKMGNKVVALGYPSEELSVTQGIVSGLARDVYEDTGYAIKCLQIDAAINPGNSGGPLFNAAGQVIAVNSAKIVASGYEGIGFSIPINEAKVIIDDILKNGYVTGRVALGITGQTYSDSHYRGFLIYTIENDSPMNKTEAKRGDLITAVDGVIVESYAELRSELAKHKVGDTVTLKLLRSENRQVREFSVSVKLAEAKGK